MQINLKAKQFFNIFGATDQGSLEKTHHPFISFVFGQATFGAAILFQALPGRERTF